MTDAHALLLRLNELCSRVLPGNLVGVYVGGSLALGDFNPASSDLDVLVVTETSVTGDEYDRLAAMHHGLGTTDPVWAGRLEVSYIPPGGGAAAPTG